MIIGMVEAKMSTNIATRRSITVSKS